MQHLRLLYDGSNRCRAVWSGASQGSPPGEDAAGEGGIKQFMGRNEIQHAIFGTMKVMEQKRADHPVNRSRRGAG
jgi:hypothetical protein